MNSIYPLEWLDALILHTFNSKGNIKMLTDSDLSFISENVLIESRKVELQLKKEFFSLRKKREMRLLVRKYHSALVFLLDAIFENQRDDLYKSHLHADIIDKIMNCLNELLSFVENFYSNYLNLDERVPTTYLIVCRKELSLKLDKLRNKDLNEIWDNKVLEIIFETLSKKIQSNVGNKITYRQIFYLKDLLNKLNVFSNSGNVKHLNSGLNQLLIAQNFNCSEYINYYIEQIIIDLDTQVVLTERMSKLLFYHKEFGQLISNEKVTFEPSQHNIKYVLENWFKHEINYLERKLELLPDKDENLSAADITTHPLKENKILCILSSDQMALILRAADESRILKAKSMNQIFKTIVPYLSTSQRKDLSYDAMRSKSYVAEDRDKEIAIKALEQMIKHIREF